MKGGEGVDGYCGWRKTQVLTLYFGEPFAAVPKTLSRHAGRALLAAAAAAAASALAAAAGITRSAGKRGKGSSRGPGRAHSGSLCRTGPARIPAWRAGDEGGVGLTYHSVVWSQS